MALNLKYTLDDLRRDVDNNQPIKAAKCVEIIRGYFEDYTLTSPQIELAIREVLDSIDGSLKILIKCLQPGKDIRKVSNGLLELYQKLLNDHTEKVKPYAKGLSNAVRLVILSEHSQAVEKEKSTLIIRELIERDMLEENHYPSLLTELQGLVPLKLTERFAQKLYQTIGIIFRNQPGHATFDQALQFRGSMLSILESFVDKRNLIKFLVVSGALDGMQYCFVNYPPDVATEPQLISRVYKIVRMFCPSDEAQRNITVAESSLRLFKLHTSLFGSHILNDASEWHDMFTEWLKNIPPKQKEFVVPAVYAFYAQVGATMAEDVNSGREKKIQLLETFLTHFKNTLLDNNSKPFQIRLAILSLGHLSGTVKSFLPANKVTDLANIVIANTNFAYFSAMADKRDKIEHLPDFIQALGLLIQQMEGITSVQLASLEKFIQALCEDFQYLAAYHHPLVIRSLVNTFHACSKLGGTILEELLSRVVLQGIAWACSQKLPMETYQEEELDWKQNVTFRHYLPLWRGLVTKVESCQFDKRPVKILIGNTFFSCLLLIIKKLNLKTKKRVFLDNDGTETELFFCDAESDLMPENASDFKIFFNLVNFYEEVLGVATKEDLKYHIPMWLPVIVQELILKSYEYPLISGFKKLLELFLKLGYRSVDVFEELLAHNDLKENLSEYFQVVIAKAKGSSGELQLACLRLLFKSPDIIVREFIEEMAAVFEIGFSIGKSVLWLAESALVCLKRNIGKCDATKVDQLLRRVLPLFDSFLLSKSDLNMDDADKVTTGKYQSKKRRMIFAPISLVADEDQDLKRVQKSMVLFLGTLEPDQCLYVIDSNANLANLTKWDLNRNIKLSIYCNDNDIHPELLLDNIMPRVFQLAKTAADRQTKVAATELVHGIILYVIRSGGMVCRRFWSEIYHVMIELACESDTAVQQIFEPLFVQVMHYKALPSQWNNEKGGNEVLIEVIMDCLSDPKEPARRDMAAKGLRELLTWTTDQATDRNHVNSIMRDIIHKINFNSADFNSDRRLGAALAFNNIYQILRKSERIVEKYWLMFLYSFSTSLWLCDGTDQMYGVEMLAEQVETSLDHVFRVIVERPQLFRGSSEERMKPESFKEANLNGAIDYVFQLTASMNLRIRKKSQAMFRKICIQNHSTVEAYLNKNLVGDSLKDFCEGNLKSVENLDCIIAEQVIEFLKGLLGTIGIFCFLLGDCKLTEKLKLHILKESSIFDAVHKFLELCENEVLSSDFSILVKQKINRLAGKIIEEMFKFFVVLSEFQSLEFEAFLNSHGKEMISLVNVICFEDHQRNLSIDHDLVRKRISQWLEKMRNNSWIHPFGNAVLTNLFNRIISELNNLETTLETVLNREAITKTEMVKFNGILTAKTYILSNSYLLNEHEINQFPLRGQNLATILFQCCRETLQSSVVRPEVKEYVNTVMRFCLEMNYQSETIEFVINSITSEDRVNLENEQRTITSGQLFRNLFRKTIFEYIISAHSAESSSDVFSVLYGKLTRENVSDVIGIISELTQYIFKYRGDQIPLREFVAQRLIAGWETISTLVSSREDGLVLVSDFVSHIGLVTPFALHEIGEKLNGFEAWLFRVLLTTTLSSDIKCQMITLLPLITGPTHDSQRELDKVLFNFRSNNIPLQSNEFKANSLERAKFGVMIKNLLDTLKISKSVTLFKFVIGVTVPEEKHLFEVEVRSTVTLLIGSVEDEMQLKFLDVAFSIFQDMEDPPEPIVRLNLFRRFIRTIIRAMNKTALISFYVNHMDVIWDLAKANYKLENRELYYIRIEHELVNRIVGYYLLELLYGTVQVSEMSEIAASIPNRINKPGKLPERGMLQVITKNCVDATKEDTVFIHQPQISELFRKYQCCAYRALCTVIMSSVIDLKFYNTLIFDNHIWSKVIGNTQDLFKSDLVVDFVDFPRVKQRIVSMKTEMTPNEKGKEFQTLRSVFTSSLSQDVTKIDFTSRMHSSETRQVTNNKAVALEDLAMNNHDLMPILCAVIEHMSEKKITSSTTPEWITRLANLMQSSDVHTNIRLFIGRLVENCKDLLQEHSSVLFGAVLKLITDKCAGDVLNIYQYDLIQMVLKWSLTYSPSTEEERDLLAKTIKFLVAHCYDKNQDAMKLNLELLRCAVTTWKDVISATRPRIIPREEIKKAPETIYCSLQVDAIFLVNDLTPWASKGEYLAMLKDNLKGDDLKIYKTSAQILGYYFALEGGSEDFLKHILQEDNKNFVDILYLIHLQFPAIVNEDVIKHIYSNIPTPIKSVLIKYLAMLLVQPIPYKEIVGMGLLNMLKQREYELYILHILNKSVNSFSEEQRVKILNNIVAVTKSSHSEARLVAYEILFKYYQSPTLTTRRGDVTYHIIHGLNDPDETVQSRLLKFWSEDANLPEELANRFPSLIETFAGVANLEEFLEVNAQLLLALLIKNPNASRQIFPNESEYDNKLAEYEINANWKAQNMSRTIPLFAKSLSDKFVPGQSSTLQFKDATLQFNPTLNTSAYPLSHTHSIPKQSSFLFDSKATQVLNENSVVNTQMTQQVTAAGIPINPLKKRLIRDKDKTERNIAVQAMTKRGFEEQRKMYAKRDRKGKVTIYRRYRYGDFPDFLINHLALLLPLQALAKRDQIIARKLFVGIFQSISDSLPDKTAFCDRIKLSIGAALKDASYCNSNVYGSFMELSFHCPRALSMEINVPLSIHNNTSALAALVLENNIANYDASGEEPRAKRRPGGTRTKEHELWMKVAELYKATKDSEVVSGIFSDKLDSDAKLIEAIALESSGRYKEAQRIFYSIIGEVQRLEMDYCFESLFNCYLEMGMWKESVEEVTRQMGDWDQLWTLEWNRENLLPNMIHSQLKMIMDEENKSKSPFLGRLDTWIKEEDRQRVLKADFAEELVMFNMISKNYLAARVLTEEKIWSFASDWGHLSVLSENIRRQRLLDIRIIAEIDSYLETLTRNSSLHEDRHRGKLEGIIRRWNSSVPLNSDSLLMWDFVFSCRKFIGNQLFEKEPAKLQEVVFLMNEKILNLSVAQRNTSIAGKMLTKMGLTGENLTNQSVIGVKFQMARANYQILGAELKRGDKGVKMAADALIEIVKLDNVALQIDSEYHLPTVLENVNLIERAHAVIRSGTLSRQKEQELLKLIPGRPKNDLDHEIQSHIQNALLDTIQMTKDFPENFSGQSHMNSIRDIHAKLAEYCYYCLERLPNEMENEHLKELIITSLLDSLRYGSPTGLKLFPSILRFKKEPFFQKLFVDKCREVPVKIFLKWIPQILSHLSFEKESYLDDLLMRIAKEYPKALYFPFQLTYEQHKFQYPASVDRSLVRDIKEAIYDPKMKTMIDALSSVSLPSVMFTTHVTNLLRTLKIRRADFKSSMERIISILKPEESLLRGPLYRPFDHIVRKLENLLHVDVSDIQQQAQLQTALEEIKKALSQQQYRAATSDLESLCPWLAMYSSVNGNNIEIPGQYADLSGHELRGEPVTIMKFANKIDVFESKTRPVKITIYGSDGKKYSFVLKYGEDLRQDQRIQQTFKLMSDNLATDKQCRSMKLHIVTYNVVPISSYFGMLSWVPDTVPLREFVGNSLAYKSDNMHGVIETIQVEHKRFLQNHSNASTIFEMYSDTAEKVSVVQLRDKFKELSTKLPSDLLRQAIVEISSSPESFYMLRNNFCRTMAAMNMAHWVLGVGDRHLQNILLNVKTCNLIGIDFNVVFESGFRVLPIPELIPFRMTPQFVNVMSPFGVTGVIKSAMTHSLRVFRNERKLLKTSLEVFLREPTIDWLLNAIFVQDEPAEFNTLSTDTRVHWDPSDRLAAVTDKLEGANPIVPIMKGLRAGNLGSKVAAVEGYVNILKGNRENIRHELPEEGLNVDEQVQCLIDLATDPAVLGITFFGIFPWL